MKTNKLLKIVTASMVMTGLFGTVANADAIQISNPDELAQYQQLLDNNTQSSPSSPTATTNHAQGEKLTVNNTILHVKVYDAYNGYKYLGTFDTKFKSVAYDIVTGEVSAKVPSNLTYGKYKSTDIGETTLNLQDGVYEYTYDMNATQSGEYKLARYWEQQSDGKWKYVVGIYDDGTKLYSNNEMSAVDNDGHYYLFDKNGIMQTGWQQYKDKWFYFYSNGQRAQNAWIGNYHVGANGVWDNQ